MKLRHRVSESPEINLTALIDVVFLLLIFFMVSTTFDRDAELSIDLPEAAAEPSDRPDTAIEVSIDAQGRYYVNGRQLVNTQAATLRQGMLKAAGESKDPPLVISADSRTPHQAVVTVMDVARQLGFLHLTFATRLGDDE